MFYAHQQQLDNLSPYDQNFINSYRQHLYNLSDPNFMRSMFEYEKLVKSNEMEKEQGKNITQKYVEKQLGHIGFKSEKLSAFTINPHYK